MSRKPRKQEQIEKVKEKILKAAYEIFKKKGFVDATIDEIAESLGIAKGTIYNYFKSKKDIIIHILINLKQELLQNLKEIIASMDSALSCEEILDKLIELFYKFNTEHKNIFVIFRQKHFWSRELKRTNLIHHFKSTFKEISDLLVEIFDFLKFKNFVNRELDSTDIALYILSIFKIPNFKEFILEKKYSEQEMKLFLKQIIFYGVINRQSTEEKCE